MKGFDRQTIIVFVIAQCLWCVLILAVAKKRVESTLLQKKKYIVDHLTEFQDGRPAEVY